MKINTLTVASVFTCFSLLLSACGGSSSEEKTDSSKEFEAAEKELSEKIETVVYDIPSPSEIPGLLQRTDVEFNAALLNEVSKADSYLSDKDKAAMNLGVYATDVGYLIAYDKVQDALNYMAESKKLADELGLAGSFESSLVKRFEENLSNKDSLTILLNQTINESSSYLTSSDRARLASLLLTGSLVEGLYISCELIKDYPTDILPDDVRNMILTDLVRVILEQEKSVNEVTEMLSGIEQSSPVEGLLTDFKTLKANYEELNVAEKISNNQGGMVLTDENLIKITETVESLRGRIVQ